MKISFMIYIFFFLKNAEKELLPLYSIIVLKKENNLKFNKICNKKYKIFPDMQ